VPLVDRPTEVSASGPVHPQGQLRAAINDQGRATVAALHRVPIRNTTPLTGNSPIEGRGGVAPPTRATEEDGAGPRGAAVLTGRAWAAEVDGQFGANPTGIPGLRGCATSTAATRRRPSLDGPDVPRAPQTGTPGRDKRPIGRLAGEALASGAAAEEHPLMAATRARVDRPAARHMAPAAVVTAVATPAAPEAFVAAAATLAAVWTARSGALTAAAILDGMSIARRGDRRPVVLCRRGGAA